MKTTRSRNARLEDKVKAWYRRGRQTYLLLTDGREVKYTPPKKTLYPGSDELETYLAKFIKD